MSNDPSRLSRREFLYLGLAGASGAALVLSRVFGQSPANIFDHILPRHSNMPQAPSLNQARAEETFLSLIQTFEQPGTVHFKEFAFVQPGDPARAYFWPYLGVVSAAAALSTLTGRGDQHMQTLKRLVDSLDDYWDASAPIPAFNSMQCNLGEGQKYYDDNEWAGLAYLEIYSLSGQSKHLIRAVDCFNFSVSGWSKEPGGGIYWREGDHSSRNTCSNAPAAVLALRLYQITGSPNYLDWAKKLLHWLNQLRSSEGVYWDSIDTERKIDRRTFAYNTGAPLQAFALLFQISKDTTYLDEIRFVAQAAYRHFTQDIGKLPSYDRESKYNPLNPNRIYSDIPWFNVILLRGLIATYDVDPLQDRKYIDHFRDSLDYAWTHARHPNGTFNSDWTGRAASPRQWLLDQAAMVECYALISRFDT